MLPSVNKKRPKLLSAINNLLYLHIYKYDYGAIDRDVSKEVAIYLSAFIRSTVYEINRDARLIGIRGARGVYRNSISYVSLDSIYFSDNTLYDFADRFVKRGGTRLHLDEVHKSPQ